VKAREFLERGRTQIRVTLDPPSLGKLRVDLDVSEHRAVARIVATSPEAAALLAREREELIRAFQQQGIHDVSVQVESGTHGTSHGHADPDGDEQPERGTGDPAASSAARRTPSPAATGSRGVDLFV